MAIDYGRLDVMGDSKFGDEFKEEARTREMSDRDWRADPSDGLRPFIKIRNSFNSILYILVFTIFLYVWISIFFYQTKSLILF